MGILSLEDMKIVDAAKELHNCCSTWHHQRRCDMNGIFQMQGGKNWILSK
jgi:hypothetical protein